MNMATKKIDKAIKQMTKQLESLEMKRRALRKFDYTVNKEVIHFEISVIKTRIKQVAAYLAKIKLLEQGQDPKKVHKMIPPIYGMSKKKGNQVKA